MEPELEHTLPGVPGSQGAGAGTEEDSKRVALCACVWSACLLSTALWV